MTEKGGEGEGDGGGTEEGERKDEKEKQMGRRLRKGKEVIKVWRVKERKEEGGREEGRREAL